TAAGPELAGHRPRLQRLRYQRSVGLPQMQPGLTGAVLVGGDVAAVLHAERREDLLPEGHVERLAAGGLDEPAHPVGIDAVLPLLVGIEGRGSAERVALGGGARGQPGGLDVAADVWVPDVVAEAGGVGEKVAERDRLPGGTK